LPENRARLKGIGAYPVSFGLPLAADSPSPLREDQMIPGEPNAPTSHEVRAFGQRTEQPPAAALRARFRPSPAQLAYALRNEDGRSLRRIVLERLYKNLTAAERRLCDAERCRIALA
jgi:hypothetical protein